MSEVGMGFPVTAQVFLFDEKRSKKLVSFKIKDMSELMECDGYGVLPHGCSYLYRVAWQAFELESRRKKCRVEKEHKRKQTG